MMKHVVCFKLHDNRPEECERAREVLLSMDGKVPMLRGISVGVDFLHSPRSYDVMLEVLLDGPEMLEPYQNDPYHCGVVKKHMHAVAQSSIAVDFLL